jgi:hypothetical protein
MKNKLGRSCSFGLVLILAATLTPVGTHVIEAKSARAAEWQVAIPESDVWNLTGVCDDCDRDLEGRVIFEDQGFRGPVRVGLTRFKVEGVLKYAFDLIFYPGTTDYGVVINGVTFENHVFFSTEELCRFAEPCNTKPPKCDETNPVCEDCMECFLNGPHPYSNYDFGIQIGTYDDVEKLEVNGAASGRLHLIMWNSYNPDNLYHRLQCASDPLNDPEGIPVTILRSGPDEWTISNLDDGGHILSCEEYYMEAVPRAGKKDGNPRDKSEKRIVMTADTVEPFLFETVWTRK